MLISKGPQIFPRSEYLRRITAVKAQMRRMDISTLVVSNMSSITYLTGSIARSSAPQGLMVSLDREEPVFILRHLDAPAAVYQTFLDRGNVIGYPEDFIGNPERDGFDAVIDFLVESKLADGVVALEFNQLTFPTVEKFKSRLPKTRIIDSKKLVSWIRMLKSDLEIAFMKEAAAISDAAILKAAEVIRPGVREADAMAEIAGALARGVGDITGTGFTHMFFCSSPRIGTPHIAWSEDTVRVGSQINLELSGVRHAYTAPLMRTFSVGSPSDRLRHVHEAEVAGLEAALKIVKPGATCSDVASAFNKTIQKFGITKNSRCGYAVGLDWLEPTASLKEGDMTELQPNMTFHLMLGNWIEEDFGYVISETFQVTPSGCEVLTKAPRILFEIR